MSFEHVPSAEYFHPGEFIADELEARGWTQKTLAEIMERSVVSINRLVMGKANINAEIAYELGSAFGTSASMWMNLQADYDLRKFKDADKSIQRRAQIYSLAPISQMVERGWIPPSNNVDVLEKSVLDFFRIKSLDDPVIFASAAFKRDGYDTQSQPEKAWQARVRQLAERIEVPPFDADRFREFFPSLKSLSMDVGNVAKIPGILHDLGVRFVVVETLQKLKIDGVAIWLDSNSPVIAMSLRFDRVDHFWFILIHEMTHILHNDKSAVDMDTEKSPDPSEVDESVRETAEMEVRTNKETVAYFIPSEKMEHIRMTFENMGLNKGRAKGTIGYIASELKIHRGILLGQLQFREILPYSVGREFLEQGRIREHVLPATKQVDGFTSRGHA